MLLIMSGVWTDSDSIIYYRRNDGHLTTAQSSLQEAASDWGKLFTGRDDNPVKNHTTSPHFIYPLTPKFGIPCILKKFPSVKLVDLCTSSTVEAENVINVSISNHLLMTFH